MQTLTRLTLALAAGVVAVPAVADSNPIPLTPEALKAHEAAVAADVAARSKRVRATAPVQAGEAPAKAAAAVASTYPGTPHANGFRTYPPSCAADPLPDAPSGPILAQERVPLLAKDGNTGDGVGVEYATLTIWRIACSSSGKTTPYNGDQGPNSMTLMRIQRDANADPNHYASFPLVDVSQDGSPFDDASRLRAANEPNTVIADTPFDAAIPDAVTFVLENYPYVGYRSFFYNYPFTLRVDPILNGIAPVDIPIPGYQPSESTYPDAYNPLPFDGYAAAQWTSDARNEGLLMQITEQWTGSGPDATYSRQVVFDLLTRDLNGNPFWLVGSALFNEGDISVTSNAYYLADGTDTPAWGKVTFVFPHCDRLDVTFVPNGGLPAPVPSISGTYQYDRLFSANGMACE